MKKHCMFFFILLLTLVTGRVYYAHSAITPIDETGYSTSNITPTPRAAAAQGNYSSCLHSLCQSNNPQDCGTVCVGDSSTCVYGGQCMIEGNEHAYFVCDTSVLRNELDMDILLHYISAAGVNLTEIDGTDLFDTSDNFDAIVARKDWINKFPFNLYECCFSSLAGNNSQTMIACPNASIPQQGSSPATMEQLNSIHFECINTEDCTTNTSATNKFALYNIALPVKECKRDEYKYDVTLNNWDLKSIPDNVKCCVRKDYNNSFAIEVLCNTNALCSIEIESFPENMPFNEESGTAICDIESIGLTSTKNNCTSEQNTSTEYCTITDEQTAKSYPSCIDENIIAKDENGNFKTYETLDFSKVNSCEGSENCDEHPYGICFYKPEGASRFHIRSAVLKEPSDGFNIYCPAEELSASLGWQQTYIENAQEYCVERTSKKVWSRTVNICNFADLNYIDRIKNENITQCPTNVANLSQNQTTCSFQDGQEVIYCEFIDNDPDNSKNGALEYWYCNPYFNYPESGGSYSALQDYVDISYNSEKAADTNKNYFPCDTACIDYSNELSCVGYRYFAESEMCSNLTTENLYEPHIKNYGFMLRQSENSEDYIICIDDNGKLSSKDLYIKICENQYTADYCTDTLKGVVGEADCEYTDPTDEVHNYSAKDLVGTNSSIVVYPCTCPNNFITYQTMKDFGYTDDDLRGMVDAACKAECTPVDIANNSLKCLKYNPDFIPCNNDFIRSSKGSVYNYSTDLTEACAYGTEKQCVGNNGDAIAYCYPIIEDGDVTQNYTQCPNNTNGLGLASGVKMFYETPIDNDSSKNYTPVPDGYYQNQTYSSTIIYGPCYFECNATNADQYCLAYQTFPKDEICEIIIDISLDGNARQSNHSKYYSLSDTHTINDVEQNTDDTGARSCVLNNQDFKAGKVYHACPDYHSEGYCRDFLKGNIDPLKTCTFNELSNLYSEPYNKLYKCTCDTRLLNKSQLQNQSFLVEGLDLDDWIDKVSFLNRCRAECSDDELIEETDGDSNKGITDCEKYNAIDILDECSNHTKEVQLYSDNSGKKEASDKTSIIMKTDGDNPGWYSTLNKNDLDENELTLYCQTSSSLTTFYRFSKLIDVNGSIAYPKEFLQDICYGGANGINSTFAYQGPFFGDEEKYIPFYAGCSCPPPYMTKKDICTNDDGIEDTNCTQFGNFHDNDTDDDAKAYPDRFKCFYGTKKDTNTEQLTTYYRYRRVDCPSNYNTLDDAWDAEVEQKIIDDKLNTFIGTQLGIKNLTDWKKYYTSAVNICSYAKDCTLENGETKCSSLDTLYADLMLDCEAILNVLDNMTFSLYDENNPAPCGGTDKAIYCKADDQTVKYLCACGNDYKLPYEDYVEGSDESTEICEFGDLTFYLHGGKCPKAKNTIRTVAADPTLDLKDYGTGVRIETCHKGPNKEKWQLLTCDPKIYTKKCEDGYKDNPNTSARWCRIGTGTGYFIKTSPIYYNKNDDLSDACIKELNICEDKFGNKEPETGDIIKMVDRKTDCVKLYGTGVQVEQCKYGTKTKYHCYYNDNAFSYSTANCPIGRDLTGPYILKNGVKYYDSCDCPVGYSYHEYNCDGELGGRVCTQNGNLTQAFVDKRIANGDNTLKTYHSDIDFYTTCTQPKVDSGSDSGDNTGDEEDGTGSGSGGSGSGSGSGDDTGDEDLGGDDESGDDILGDDDLGGDDDTGDDILGDDNTGDDEDGTGSGSSGSGSGSGGSGSGNIKSTWATCYYCCPAGKSPTGNTRQGTKGREFECK